MKSSLLAVVCVLSALVLMGSGGCQRKTYDPARATRPYPDHLHRAESVDMQVFRKGDKLTIYNATARSYRDFDFWVNQQFVHHVDALAAAGKVTVSLWDFWDERGEVFNAGGIWRVYEPTPVRLVEIQLNEEEPMIQLITIRAEPVD